MVIDYNFDSTFGFSEGLAAIEIDNKWGFVNIKGDIQIKPSFVYINYNKLIQEAYYFQEGLSAVWIGSKEKGKVGFINKKGDIVIKPIYDESKKEDPYIIHKLNIENILATKHKNYLIFRITNPIGKTKNKTTFLNYFIDKIKNNENFEVWSKSSRNIIDIEDLYKICDSIIRDNKNKNKIINIGSPNFYSTSDIVNQIESHLNKKGRYHIVNKGGAPIFDNSISNEVSKFLNINFKNDYLVKILKKYFPTDE